MADRKARDGYFEALRLRNQLSYMLYVVNLLYINSQYEVHSIRSFIPCKSQANAALCGAFFDVQAKIIIWCDHCV